MRDRTQLAVVGGGPAGVAAAVEAARQGMKVTLIDEGSTLGGQYFRGRSDSTEEGSPLVFERERSVLDIEVCLESVVIDAPEQGFVSVMTEGQGIRSMAYDHLVLATGAYDRPVALPGWTLPGVFTAGGASSLVRSQEIIPGRRVVVAGSGPFLLPVADELAGKGCQVHVVEATPFSVMISGVPIVATDWEILSKTIGYAARLTARRVRRLYSHMVTKIQGDHHVEAVTIHRVDDKWQPISGSGRVIEADAVCFGFGFVPHLDLAQLLGCEISYSAETSQFYVKTDKVMRTSKPKIYAAGELTGIGGVRVAVVEGRLAGITAARDAGIGDKDRYELTVKQLSQRLARVHRLADWISKTYRPRPGLWTLADPSTVICRCEDVTLGRLLEEGEINAATPQALKTATRAGMGLCQGHICCTYIMEWLQAQHVYQIPSYKWPWSVQPPLRPSRLDDWLLKDQI